MPSDEVWAPKPKFRKKKRVVEDLSSKQDQENFSYFKKDWDPDKTGDSGLWCGECRKRVPWKKLASQYETRNRDIYRIWFCPVCDNMVREDNLTDLGFVHDMEAKELKRAKKKAKKRAKKNRRSSGD